MSPENITRCNEGIEKVNFPMHNRPFAAKPSRDLFFIKLWEEAEMERAHRKYQNGQV